jgi:hypothetical protein
MCQFTVREVGFVRFFITSDGIGMESHRMFTIEDWPTTESVQDVEMLLGIANFYRRFFRKYATVTAPITNLLKAQSSRIWEWTHDPEPAFRKIKKIFTEAPILPHFNLEILIILQTDETGFAIDGILNH